MEGPLKRQWSLYQNFWASVWRDLARIVLSMKERYGTEVFESYDVDVNLDKLVEVDLEALSKAWSVIYQSMFTPLVMTGMLSFEAAKGIILVSWRQVLQAFGVKDADLVITPKMFEPTEGEEPTGGVSQTESAAIVRAASRILERG